MRMTYKHSEEAAFARAKKQLCGRFTAWLTANAPAGRADAATVSEIISTAETALDYRFGYSDGRLGHWTAADLDDFLLWWFPRKVTMPDSDVRGVVPGVRAWINFLAEVGLLDPLSDVVAVLEEALGRIERDFSAAMADESRWGIGKSLGMAMLGAGIDVTDEDAVGRFITSYNEGLSTGYDMPPFPAVRLKDTAALAEAAAESTMVRRVRTFVEWVGAGRALTQTGRLKKADGAELIELLGTNDVMDPVIGDRVFRTVSTDELLGVNLTFEWAKAAGFVRTVKRRVVPVKKRQSMLADPLATLERLYDSLFDLEEVLYDRRYFPSIVGVAYGDYLVRMLTHLYAAVGERISIEETLEPAWELLTDRYGCDLRTDKDLSVWRSVTDSDLVDAVALAADLGIVTADGDLHSYRLSADLLDGEEAGSGPQTQVELSPLGLWAVNRSIRAVGLAAPVVGELAAADATTLCATIRSYDIESFDTEISEWLDARAPQAATGELVELVRDTDDPGLRMVAMTALTRIDPQGHDALGYLAGEPVFGTLAKVNLMAIGRLGEDALTHEEALVVMVETLAALDEVDQDDVVSALARFGGDQEGLVGQLWSVPHPAVADVLQAIAAHHPERRVAKAARRALFKARSRQPATKPR